MAKKNKLKNIYVYIINWGEYVSNWCFNMGFCY